MGTAPPAHLSPSQVAVTRGIAVASLGLVVALHTSIAAGARLGLVTLFAAMGLALASGASAWARVALLRRAAPASAVVAAWLVALGSAAFVCGNMIYSDASLEVGGPSGLEAIAHALEQPRMVSLCVGSALVFATASHLASSEPDGSIWLIMLLDGLVAMTVMSTPSWIEVGVLGVAVTTVSLAAMIVVGSLPLALILLGLFAMADRFAARRWPLVAQ